MQNSAIGDGILLFPVMAALRKAYGPGIAWGGRQDIGELAFASGLAVNYRPSYRDGYDLVLNFNQPLPEASKARYGCPVTDMSIDGRAAEYLPSQALRHLGLPPEIDFGLAGLRMGMGDGVALITGASTPVKVWPEDRWMAMAKALPGQLVLPSDNDGGLANRIAGSAPGRATVIRGSLLAVAHALGQCRAYVGVETGLSHLAHALGLPGAWLWAFQQATAYQPGAPAKVLTLSATAADVKGALNL